MNEHVWKFYKIPKYLLEPLQESDHKSWITAIASSREYL